jgi:hypothetical protein
VGGFAAEPHPDWLETRLIVHRTTATHGGGCDPLTQQNVVVASITTPAFSTPGDGQPAHRKPGIENATLVLAGRNRQPTLRVLINRATTSRSSRCRT